MTEVTARINQTQGVELVSVATSSPIAAISMNPVEAAYLARDLLASAAALCSDTPPKAGAMIGDAHIPFKGQPGWSNVTGNPSLCVSVPPGIELTFEMTREAAKELGASLIALAEQRSPLGDHPSTVH